MGTQQVPVYDAMGNVGGYETVEVPDPPQYDTGQATPENPIREPSADDLYTLYGSQDNNPAINPATIPNSPEYIAAINGETGEQIPLPPQRPADLSTTVGDEPGNNTGGNEEVDTGDNAGYSDFPSSGITGEIDSLYDEPGIQDFRNAGTAADWRVRIKLPSGSSYLYNDGSNQILQPLRASGGVIFPYTPQVTVNYAANYEAQSLIHSNYKVFQYQNSSVDSIQVTGDFTAQDNMEANYLLAVIHFFRSATKMFYGQDSNPPIGTPPPVVYLYGYGPYQFDGLPMVVNSFNYTLPQDVDFIPTQGHYTGVQVTQSPMYVPQDFFGRLGASIMPGGMPPPPKFNITSTQAGNNATWVPTKITLTVNCFPVYSRNDVSNRFSFRSYANGSLKGMW